MKNNLSLFLAASLLTAVLIPSMVNAGNIKKSYINLAKDGNQATSNDLPSNFSSISNIVNNKIIPDYAKGNTGILNGTTMKTEESGVTFDGGVGGIVSPNSPVFNWSKGITVEAWAKTSQTASSANVEQGIVSKSTANNREFHLRFGKNGTIETWISLDGANPTGATAISSNTFTLNDWHHVAFTYNGSFLIVYLDGVKGTPISKSGKLFQGNSNVFFGQWAENNNYNLKGNIKEVRIWNYPRTEQEIKGNMSKVFKGNEDGLVGYWKF